MKHGQKIQKEINTQNDQSLQDITRRNQDVIMRATLGYLPSILTKKMGKSEYQIHLVTTTANILKMTTKEINQQSSSINSIIKMILVALKAAKGPLAIMLIQLAIEQLTTLKQTLENE